MKDEKNESFSLYQSPWAKGALMAMFFSQCFGIYTNIRQYLKWKPGYEKVYSPEEMEEILNQTIHQGLFQASSALACLSLFLIAVLCHDRKKEKFAEGWVFLLLSFCWLGIACLNIFRSPGLAVINAIAGDIPMVLSIISFVQARRT